MHAIDYRTLAEEWLDHVARQYEAARICLRDVPVIEHLLKAGFALRAIRDSRGVVRVDCLGKRSRKRKTSHLFKQP